METSRLVIRAVSSPEEWDRARQIRTVVFIEEQRCAPEEEWDEWDDTSRHLLAWLGDFVIGVARWRAVTHAGRVFAKMERFAILADYRGRGYGRELVLQTMEDARRAGFEDFLLHAQSYLEGLYEGLGFVTEGETFMEAGIPHVRMVRIEGGVVRDAEPRESSRF